MRISRASSFMRLDPNMPSSTRTSQLLSNARTPAEPQCPCPGGELEREHGAQLVVLAVGSEAEQDLQQQHRSAAAQACGRAAVGYAIGNGVSARGSPAKTSGSW